MNEKLPTYSQERDAWIFNCGFIGGASITTIIFGVILVLDFILR